jgi:hypothetical protein
MIKCIGVQGDIVPKNKNWGTNATVKKLGSVTDAINSSGFMAIDLFYTLSRSSFTIEHIQQLLDMARTCQVHFARLFALKQALLGSEKYYGGIKLHIVFRPL